MSGLAQICQSAEISHLSVAEVWTLLPSLGLNSAAATVAARGRRTTRHPGALTADPWWHFFQSLAHICVNIPWHSDTRNQGSCLSAQRIQAPKPAPEAADGDS